MHLVLALYSKWTYLKNFRHIIFLSIFFLFFRWAVRFFLKQVQVEEYRWCLKQLAKPVLRGLGKFVENFWTLFTKFAVKRWQHCADIVKNFWQHCPNTVQPWLSRFLGTELIGPDNKKIGIVIFMIFSFVTKDTLYSVTFYSEMVCSRAFPLAFAYCIFDSFLKKCKKKNHFFKQLT